MSGRERAIRDTPESERRERRLAEALGDDADLFTDGVTEAFYDAVVEEGGIPRDVDGDVRDGLERLGGVDLAVSIDLHVADDVLGDGRELDQDASGVHADLLPDTYLDCAADVESLQEGRKKGGHLECGSVVYNGAIEVLIRREVGEHVFGRVGRLVEPMGNFVAVRPFVHLVVEGVGGHGVAHVVGADTLALHFEGVCDLF